MQFNLIGGDYKEDFSVISQQRTINLYQESTEGFNQQMQYVLKSREGLKYFTTVNAGNPGPNRGLYCNSADEAFMVQSNKLFQFFPSGAVVERGTLLTFNEPVQMCDNGSELLIVDGTYGYIYTFATNNFQRITSVNFPPKPIGCAFQSAFFVVIEGESQRFHVSRANNGLQWDAVDVASAEANSDNLVAIQSQGNNIWLFGSSSYEVWSIIDNIFPFYRVAGAANNIGVLAPGSVSQINNVIYFIGSSKNGYGFVYETSGYSVRQISTYPISQKISTFLHPQDAISFTYNDNGHYFYILTFKSDNITYCFDVNERSWSERTSLTTSSIEQRWKALNYCFAFGKSFVGDIGNSKLYILQNNYPYDDIDDTNKVSIVRTRISPFVFEPDRKYLYFKKMELLFQSGQGIDGQFTTGTGGGDEQAEIIVRYPQIFISWSDDYGKTYSNERQVSVGGRGQYDKRVIYTALGTSRSRCFKIRWSDAITTPLVYATLDVVPGKF